MRIKENSDSWRASSILRCGIKHDHSEISIMFHSSKDTRKWCSVRLVSNIKLCGELNKVSLATSIRQAIVYTVVRSSSAKSK